MSGFDPIDVAIAAYDAKLNEQLGNPPGFVLGSGLRDSPAIVAMLAAHEKAVVERILNAALSDLDDESNPFAMALAARTRRVRETIAADIKALAKEAAKTDDPAAILGLITAASIAEGKRFGSFDALGDELDAALADGSAR